MPSTFLADFITDVRLAVDDPVVNKKYDDAAVVRFAGAASKQLFRDLSALSSNPVVMSHNISVTATQRSYVLPPCIGEVLQIGEFDTTNNWWKWRVSRASRFGPFPTIRLQGRSLVYDRNPGITYTLRVEYVPSNDFKMHSGARSFTAALLAANEFALVEPATSPTYGTVDDRDDAYIGAILRVYPTTSGSTVQEVCERVVTDYVVSSAATGKQRLLTLDFDLSPALTQDGATGYTYEVVPMWADSQRDALAMSVALKMCAFSTMPDKYQMIEREYRKSLRLEKLAVAQYGQPYVCLWEMDTNESFLGGFMP